MDWIKIGIFGINFIVIICALMGFWYNGPEIIKTICQMAVLTFLVCSTAVDFVNS